MRAARVDQNQLVISDALIKAGCTVQSLAVVGLGVPDLLVGFRGHNLLMEVKNPDQDPNKQKLTEAQVKFHARWKGQSCEVRTPQEALNVIADILLAGE